MSGVEHDGEVAGGDVQRALVEQQLAALERQRPSKESRLAWLLAIAGWLAIVGLGVHGSVAYASVRRIDANARIETPNPLLLFQDLATNGPRAGATIESASRAAYTRALEQFVLDGTGVLLGIVLLVSGLFVRLNL